MCYPFVSTTEWARRRFLIISVCRPEARQNRCWNTSDDSDTACDRSGALKTCVSGGSSAERTCSLTAPTRFLALVSAQFSPVERRAAEGLTHCSRVHKLSSSWLNRSLLMHFICAELKALKVFFFSNQFPTNCSDTSEHSRNHLPDYFMKQDMFAVYMSANRYV